MSELPDTLPGLIEASSQRFADRTAVIDGARRLSYPELAALVRRTARALIATGIEAGDTVCVWSPNTYHWIVAALGAQAAGARLVTLNTRFTGAEALDILDRTNARALFLPDRFLGNDYLATLRAATGSQAVGNGPLAALATLELVVRLPLSGEESSPEPGVISWEQLLARSAEVDEQSAAARMADVTGDDVADILFTSGTTGRPKGAMSSHRQTIAVAASWAQCAQVTEQDVYLVTSPFFHSFGYKAGWVVALLRGATIIPQLTFDVDELLETV